jgi:RNA polymerase sigma-54 factor
MKQSLELRLGQRLTITPQLQQAIKLLQLSALDLTTEIQQALDENPLLEEQDGEDEPGVDDQDNVTTENTGALSGNDEREAATDDETSMVSADEIVSIGEDPEITEWSEHFESHVTGIRNEGGSAEYEDRNTNPATLKDHLMWQMHMTPFSDTDCKIAVSLIDAIDEDGYLKCSFEDIVSTLAGEDIDVEIDEVEATLHQIQNFDPLGVAARDLRECLLLQLRQFDQKLEPVAHASVLIEQYFDLLTNRALPQIRRLMKLDEASLGEAIKLIQSLHPRPGNAVAPAQPDYIVPDIIVKKVKGVWRAEINGEAFPQVRINGSYQALLGKSKGGDEKKYIQQNLQEARWFIKSLNQRNETLLRVARTILERQQEFFEQGEQGMKPMVLHDIAETLDLHESTISRATTQKYMLTPRGVFELKYFFSSHVGTADGGTCSSTVIRTMIKQYVESEPPTKPISDSQISRLLAQKGINVARRTIAKYRENMHIPPSSQRKTIA